MDNGGSPGTPASRWYPSISYWHEQTLCPLMGSVNRVRPVSQHLCAAGGLPEVGADEVTAMLDGGDVD